MSPSRLPATLSAIALLCLLAACTSAPSESGGNPSSPSSTDPVNSAENFAGLSSYYPVGEGNTWTYTMTYPEPIGIVTETETMTSVEPDGNGGAIATITRDFHHENGNTPDFSDSVTYLFHADGSLEVPFQTIPSADPTSVVTITGGTMVWPSTAEFEAGTVKTGEITATVEAGGQTFDQVIAFEIFGNGQEEVTVPFGTFTARKLVQNLTVKVASFGLEVPITATSWLQADVGLVRTEIPDLIDGASITVELVSFTPGS